MTAFMPGGQGATFVQEAKERRSCRRPRSDVHAGGQGAILSLANRSSLDPGHILHGQLFDPQADSKERLKSGHLLAPAARKLLHNLSELGMRAAQWTNLTWDTECSKSMSALGVYIPRVSTRPIGV